MKSLLVLALAALVAGASAASADPPSLTLREAVDAALSANPAVTAANAGRDLAAARLREARSGWLPRVEATETVMRSDNPVFVFGSLLEQGRFGAQHFDPGFLNDPDALSNFRLAVNVRYTLFDQLRRLHGVRQARNGVEQAESGAEEARQRIRLETISRYYGVVVAERKLEVARDAVASAEADAASMRDRFEQGLLVESDLLAAEVQAASLRQRLIEAEGELAVARAALATVVQRPVAEAIAVQGGIPERALPERPLDEALAAALASRGEIVGARKATENASLQAKTARGSLLPRVDGFASWGQSGSSLAGGDPDSAMGVVIGVDLFDGGKRARIASARAGVDAARAAEASVRDRVTMEVVSAWHRVRSAKERIGVATLSVDRAAAAARIVRDRYENGLTTITEQLRAQNALLVSRLELLAARYDTITGYAELLRSTGGLHDVEQFQ